MVQVIWYGDFFIITAKNGFVLRNGVKGAILGGAVKLDCLSSITNFSLKLFDAFIMSECSRVLRPTGFT